MSGEWETSLERDRKTKKLRFFIGTWGKKEGTHLISPSESQLVEMAMTLLNAAWAMKSDRLNQKRAKASKPKRKKGKR